MFTTSHRPQEFPAVELSWWKRKQGNAAEAAERAKREWQLTKPFTDYAGEYRNDLGAMNTVATPFTEKDTVRVVMLPGGNGEVIGFVKDAEGKFGSLIYGGFTFTRLAQ